MSQPGLRSPDGVLPRGPVGAARWALARVGHPGYWAGDPLSGRRLVLDAYRAAGLVDAVTASLVSDTGGVSGAPVGAILTRARRLGPPTLGLVVGADWVCAAGQTGLALIDARSDFGWLTGEILCA